MSLKNEMLDSWTTNKVHPASAPAIRSSKRLKGSVQSTSDLSHHQTGKSEAKTGTPEAKTGNPVAETPPSTSPGVSESSQKDVATLAPHANAISTTTSCTSGMVDKMLTAAAKFDVDDVCGLLAAGSTGPVYRARCIPWLLDCMYVYKHVCI